MNLQKLIFLEYNFIRCNYSKPKETIKVLRVGRNLPICEEPLGHGNMFTLGFSFIA